jgi:flagellar biosynthesis/type III secretory pathway protein FliH
MEAEDQNRQEAVTVETYRPGHFAEAAWEVVADESKQESFQAEQFESINPAKYVVDPMFADFSQLEQNAEVKPISEIPKSEPKAEPDQSQFNAQPEFVAASAPQLGSSTAETSTGDHFNGDEASLNESDSSQDSGETEQSATNNEQSYVEAELDSGAKDPQEELQAQSNQVEIDIEPNEQPVREPIIAAPETVDVPPQPEVPQHESEVFSVMDQALRAEYERGLAAAREQVELIQKQYEERYTVIWEDMQTQLDEAIAGHERQAVDLAFQIARRLVGDAVGANREYIVPIIQQAIKSAGGARIKSVRVSPADFEFLSLGSYGEIIKSGQDTKLIFESDESIRSGCVLCTTAGEIDCDLDKAWERLRSKTLDGAK